MRSLLIVLAVLFLASPAQAAERHRDLTTTVVGMRAIYHQPLLVPMPPTVRFVRGQMPGDTSAARGMGAAVTDPNTGTIYSDGPLDRFSRAHEIGHVLDAEVLTDADRQTFRLIMRVPGDADWWNGPGDDDGLRTPCEWFADYYAAAATRMDARHGGVVSYATITPRRLARFEQTLDALGRRYGLAPYR